MTGRHAEAEQVADATIEHPTVAVAESVTGGLLMGLIVGTPDSGTWFQGGVVAYQSRFKVTLLGVEPGPVVNARTARQMANGVREMFGTDIGVSTTGVAGPESVENQEVGSVFTGWSTSDGMEVIHLDLNGDPGQIRSEAVSLTYRRLMQLRSSYPAGIPTAIPD